MVRVALVQALLWSITAAQNQECLDGHQFCTFWSSIGECTKNPVWMARNCRLACAVCNTSRGDIERCERIRQESPNLISLRMIQENTVVTREDTSKRAIMTLSIARNENSGANCAPPIRGTMNCSDNLCYHLLYRTFDGTCNNFDNPLWGAAFTPYIRHFPPIYDDGIGSPVGADKRIRPSPRDASRFLLSSSQVVNNNDFNSLVMQWGQFISHDMSRTMQLPNLQCTTCINVHPTCSAIPVNDLDPNSRVFGCEAASNGPHCCVRTARSTPVCGTGSGAIVREQYSENTAYIDASNIYGSSEDDNKRLRAGTTGFLRVEEFTGRAFPPFSADQCTNASQCNANFQAGDDRANLFIGLASLHTLFLREHNRIITALSRINPHWSGERLFQEGRKIVGSTLQAITFKEYLPKILGKDYKQQLPEYTKYDPNVQATIANDFTTGAFRFGHGMINEFFDRPNDSGETIAAGVMKFADGVFQSKRLLFEGGIDPFLRGLMVTPAKRPHRITPALTERMFGSLDLASINIQRGRDHGLVSYNHYRGFCKNFGLRQVSNFSELSNEMLDAAVRQNLEQGYKHPDNIDLYVGMLLEDPVPEGMVGPTLTCMLGEQFKRLRDGDRFWYQNPGVFSPAQLKELDKISLARVICDNGDQFSAVPLDAFKHMPMSNFTNCNNVPVVDLTAWQEFQPI